MPQRPEVTLEITSIVVFLLSFCESSLILRLIVASSSDVHLLSCKAQISLLILIFLRPNISPLQVPPPISIDAKRIELSCVFALSHPQGEYHIEKNQGSKQLST